MAAPWHQCVPAGSVPGGEGAGRGLVLCRPDPALPSVLSVSVTSTLRSCSVYRDTWGSTRLDTRHTRRVHVDILLLLIKSSPNHCCMSGDPLCIPALSSHQLLPPGCDTMHNTVNKRHHLIFLSIRPSIVLTSPELVVQCARWKDSLSMEKLLMLLQMV